MKNLLILIILFCSLSGCSAGMALSGKKEPDLVYVQKGASRQEIEHQLGRPIESKALPNGQTENVYEYEFGNKPSAGKAAGYAILDVLTLGIYEIVNTPIEAAGGKGYRIKIKYDNLNNAVEVGQPIQIGSE